MHGDSDRVHKKLDDYLNVVESVAAKLAVGDLDEGLHLDRQAGALLEEVNSTFTSPWRNPDALASALTKGAVPVVERLGSLLASAVAYTHRAKLKADRRVPHLHDLEAMLLFRAPLALFELILELLPWIPASEPSSAQLYAQLHDINLLCRIAAAVKEAPAMARRAADQVASAADFVSPGLGDIFAKLKVRIYIQATSLVVFGANAASSLKRHVSRSGGGSGGSSSTGAATSGLLPDATVTLLSLLHGSKLLPAVSDALMAMPPPSSVGLQGADAAKVLGLPDVAVEFITSSLMHVALLAEGVIKSPEAQAAHRRAPGAATGSSTSGGPGASSSAAAMPSSSPSAPSGAAGGSASTTPDADVSAFQEQARLLITLLTQPEVVRLQRALVRRLCVRGLGAAGGEVAVEWWLLDEELRLGRPLRDADMYSAAEVVATLQAWFITHLVARIADIPLPAEGGGGTSSGPHSGGGGVTDHLPSSGPATAIEGALPTLAEVAALGTKIAYALRHGDEVRSASGTVPAISQRNVGLGPYMLILQRLPEAMPVHELQGCMADWVGMGAAALSWGAAADLRGARLAGKGALAALLTRLWMLAEHEEVGLDRLSPSIRSECVRRMREARLAPVLDNLLRAHLGGEEAEPGSATPEDDAYSMPRMIVRLLNEGAVELLNATSVGVDSGTGAGEAASSAGLGGSSSDCSSSDRGAGSAAAGSAGVGSSGGGSRDCSGCAAAASGSLAAAARPSGSCEPAGPDAHGEAPPADVPEDELGVIVTAAKHARLLAGRFEEVPRGDPSSRREWSTGRGRQGGRIPAILTLQLLASAFRNMRPQLSSRLEAAARAREAAAAQGLGGGAGGDPRVSCVGRAHQATAFTLRSGCTLAAAVANLTAALAPPPEAERSRIESKQGNGIRPSFAPEAAAGDAAACACDMLGAWTDMASGRPPLPSPQLLASQPHRLMAATAQLLPALQPGGRLAGRVGGALAAALEAAVGSEQLRAHALSWMAPLGGAVAAPATAASSASQAPEAAPVAGRGAVEAGLPPAPELRGCLRGPLEAAASQLAAASPGPAGRLRALLAPAAAASRSASGGGSAKKRPSGAQVACKRLGGQAAPLPPLLSVPLRAAALPQLKVCANPRCSTFEQPSEAQLIRGRCRNLVWSCGQECHVHHWRGGHNQECPAARKAR